MPPTPIPENNIQTTEVVEEKKYSWSTILVIAVVTICIMAIGYGITASLGIYSLYRAVNDATAANEELNKQVAQTPDTIVASHACVASPYSWAVLQKDRVYAQMLGGSPGSIHTYRALALTRDGKTVAESDYVYDLIQKRTDYVPAGYSRVYVVDESALKKDQSYSQARQISITRSAVPSTDFESVAQCLRDNVTEINDEIKAESEEYFYRPIGWILYENA